MSTSPDRIEVSAVDDGLLVECSRCGISTKVFPQYGTMHTFCCGFAFTMYVINFVPDYEVTPNLVHQLFSPRRDGI